MTRRNDMEPGMNETLKAAGHIGAELAAAKAELQLKHEAHRKTWRQLEQVTGLLRELRDITSEYAWDADLEARVDAALPQQAEPCGTCEPEGVMATDGAGPFDCPDCGKKAAARNGSEKAETRTTTGPEGAAQPAPAQDERRDAFNAADPELNDLLNLAVEIYAEGGNHDSAEYMMELLGKVEARLETRPAQDEQAMQLLAELSRTPQGGEKVTRERMAAICEVGHDRAAFAARLTRPAQTEQQPVAPEGWRLVPINPSLEMIAALGFDGDELLAVGHGAIFADVEQLWRKVLDAAPIAQPAPQPVEVVAWANPVDLEELKISRRSSARYVINSKSGAANVPLVRQSDHLAALLAATAPQPEQSGFIGHVCGGDGTHNTVNVAVVGPVPWGDLRIGTPVRLIPAPATPSPAMDAKEE